MFERLILCEYAVADLTTANANVFYELGVRHGIRPRTTVMVFAEHSRLPFDVGPVRAVPYRLASGKPSSPVPDSQALREMLEAARADMIDSPVFQLVADLQPPDISRLKTDVFRDRVEYATEVKRRLAEARRLGRDEGPAAVTAIHRALGPIDDIELGVLVDLLLSYRAVEAWNQMIELASQMPEPLAKSVLVREQHALALNRAGRSVEAEALLLQLIDEQGPSSETLGILGRVYKDRWEAEADPLTKRGLLKRAIDAYLEGFESDWRDAYPGVNAVTLMEIADPPDDRRRDLLPVVRYASSRRLAAGEPDYWDYATLLELAVLAKDRESALEYAALALANVREDWEVKSTHKNLSLISDAWQGRGEAEYTWLQEILDSLTR
jgi:hypothetical protein